MLLCKPKKILLMFNPRVGSKSIRQLMTYLNSERSIFTMSELGMRNVHLRAFPRYYPNETLDGYRIFSFYRDPIERFLSGMEQHFTAFPERLPRTLTVAEYIEETNGFIPQTYYLNPEGYTVELFNFEDFANEVVRMAAEFDYSIRANQVPHENESVNRKQRTDLTVDEVQLIKNHYAGDYQFLQSRGIIFT